MQPTALSIRLPAGNSELPSKADLYDSSGHEAFCPSVMSIHVGSDLANSGLSSVPFTSLLDLGDQFPNLRALRLRCIISNPNASQGALTSLPCFASLESLTIVPGLAQLPRDTLLTRSALSLLSHMPRLHSLTVYAPLGRPYHGHESGTSYPDATFSLRRFVCVGGLSPHACAHIISHSWSTLEELKVDAGWTHAGADEARLVSALALAAPRLRVLDLRLGGNPALSWSVKPVLSALARVRTLRLGVPLALQDALALLDGHASLCELNLRCTLYYSSQASPAAADFAAYLLRVPRLRRITLQCFSIGKEDRGAMLDHFRARRIHFSVTE